MKTTATLVLLAFFIGCRNPVNTEDVMNKTAEAYVKLVLEVGLYDADYVDAYYGPDEWKPGEETKSEKFPYEKLKEKTVTLLAELDKLKNVKLQEELLRRSNFLARQIKSVGARIDMLGGRKFTFDEESKALYDAVSPSYTEEHYQQLLNELENSLPGKGSLQKRLVEFKKDFEIPVDKLEEIFDVAIKECRKRSNTKIPLPENEDFVVEYVKDKPWGAYNWYKGNSFSVIQFNTDITAYIDRAIDLACHEGYPGHHVFNALLENKLYREKDRVEYCVYPLFSPQSLIAEGTANFGIEVAFPGDEKINFEKEILFPIAGIDPSKAENYYRVMGLTSKLNFAGNDAARNYIDGKFTKEEAISFLVKYLLMTPERASKRIDFIDKYGSYVINYNLGQKLVREYIEKLGGTADNPEKRWQLFAELLQTPLTPSELK